MLNEISPRNFNISKLKNGRIGIEDFILSYSEGKVLMTEDDGVFSIPRKSQFGKIIHDEGILLGELDEEKFFLTDELGNIPSGFCYMSMQEARVRLDKLSKWIVALGLQFNRWINDNKFCGRCGNEMKLHEDETAIECNLCSNLVFPKLSPAIIVAITNGSKILLAKHRLHSGAIYSLVAGYVEAGETMEETVKREVMEEVGVEVKNIKYYKSQPWPFSSSLMIGFFAEYDGDRAIRIDEKELLHADWYEAGALPEIPSSDSVAGEMIRVFRDINS